MTTSRPIQPLSPTPRRAGRGLVLAAWGILLATVLSACASSGGSSNDPVGDDSAASISGADARDAEGDTLDSCSLLTEDQLSAIVGTAVSVQGPAVDAFRGRSCGYTFAETSGSILDEGTIQIAAWHGTEFFVPGAIGGPRSGIGEEAQDDSDHGVVMFRVGAEVVQVQVISSDQRRASVEIARAAAGQVAGA